MRKAWYTGLVLICCLIVGMTAVVITNLRQYDEDVQDISQNTEISVTYESTEIQTWEVLGEIYIFLPSYFDRSDTWIEVSGGSLSLDGGAAADSICLGDLGDSHYTYEFIYDGTVEKSGNLYIYQSASTATVSIYTESGSMEQVDADKEYKESGSITVRDESGSLEYSGVLEYIKSRGNATWSTEKKSYAIKLKDAADLLDMGRAKQWILVSGVYDGTKLLNKICMDMADAVGLEYSVESEWVDLYINGEYHGNYLLCEKIQIADNRIDTNAEYLIEVDCYMDEETGFITDDGNRITIHYPEECTSEDKATIRNLVQCAEDAVLAGDMEEAGKYIDWDSFVLRYILDEFVMNFDTGITSTYFYVSDGKLYSGPVWDYDNSLGSGAYSDWMDYTMIVAEEMVNIKASEFTWYSELYQNEMFQEMLAEKYEEVMRPYLVELMEEGVDGYAEEARYTVKMDMARWDYSVYHAGHYEKYDNNVRYIKWFIAKRLEFLDGEWLGEENTYEFDDTGEIHTVEFIGTNGTYTIEVPDGDVITETPDELLGEEGWWSLDERDLPINPYLPILEDMTFVEKVG